ncbi:glycosyltransferase [Thermaurantiacus sp.]
MIEITIPVLNEEQTLDQQVRKVMTYIDTHLRAYGPISLVISDNGSTDRTPEIARSLEEVFPGRLRYLRLGERGVGRALKASWKSSRCDIVGYMDLDLATSLDHLAPALDRLLAGADIVAGTRLAPGSRVVGRRWYRAITSRVFNMIVRLMFNTRFTDGMCGFKFMKRAHVERLIDAGAASDGWIFCTELLIVAEFLGLEIVDLPVTWTDDPNSKVRIGKLTKEYLTALRVLRGRLRAPAGLGA